MFQIIAQEIIQSASIKRSTNSEHTVVIIDDNTNYKTQESLSVDHVSAHTSISICQHETSAGQRH